MARCELNFSIQLIRFIRDYFGTSGLIPLHQPVFLARDREYVVDCIDSTFVSSVGSYVDEFEQALASYTAAPKAVATVNGTAALHLALKCTGVAPGDLVITQPLTFVATCNAISYCGAEPIFVDVDRNTLGLSAKAVQQWLEEHAALADDGFCRTRDDRRIIRACLPVHTFGHPVDLDGLSQVLRDWNIVLVEDAAESLGSFYKGKHTGTFGRFGTLSFNGNKIITTGGGGALLTDHADGKVVKHISTTAKKSHPFEYDHDEVAYNYRLPNLNAALGCAQLERLPYYLAVKRALAEAYKNELSSSDFVFVCEPKNCRSNYWLNAVTCEDEKHRNAFLKITHKHGIMTRPIWKLMSHLKMFRHCRSGDLSTAKWLEARIVNLPSGVVAP